MSDVTRIPERVEKGDGKAAEDLLPLVYEELRRLAAAKISTEEPGQTLQPTALVHEAWLRLVRTPEQSWQNGAHFVRTAAECMRRILIDTARRKQQVRHGGGQQRVPLDGLEVKDEFEPTGVSSDNTISLGITIAYSSGGVPLWTNRFAGGSYGIAVGRAGNVFATGSGTNNDYVTIKYSSSVPPPRLDFQKLNNQLVLSWTKAGFTLQSAPLASGTFTNISGATSPYSNSMTSAQQYFRLAAP